MEANIAIELIKLLSTMPTLKTAEASIFSALNLGDDEEWHSDLLAWFLNPNGPLEDGWLLKNIFKHIGRKLPGGKPLVIRERQFDTSRPDIFIEWDNFKVLIENKTKSTEHSDQCKRYLEAFKINDKIDGFLIFLSHSRKPWPKSISRDDKRVYGLSYRELSMLLKQGLKKELDGRAKVYVSDYLEEVNKMTGELTVRIEEPVISDSTKIINKEWSSMIKLKSQAAEESKAYIEWTLSLALKEINTLEMGKWNAHCPFGSTILFSRDDLNFYGHLLGIAYSPEGAAGTKLISEYTHLVGVRMYVEENREIPSNRFRNIVREALFEKWDAKAVASIGLNTSAQKTIRSNQKMWPVYKTVIFNNPDNWGVWGEKLCDTLVGFVSAFNPAIEQVAKSLEKKGR